MTDTKQRTRALERALKKCVGVEMFVSPPLLNLGH